MFLVCRVVARGKVVVPDIIKEADEGLSFAAFFLDNFDCNKYSLLEVYLADDGCGKNSIQTELQHPLRVALMFGKTYVKFVVRDKECDDGAEGESSLVDVLMSSARRQARESRKDSKPQLPEKISPEKKKSFNQKDKLSTFRLTWPLENWRNTIQFILMPSSPLLIDADDTNTCVI